MDDSSERKHGVFMLYHSKSGSIAAIHEHGATILSWHPSPADGMCEALFVSRDAKLDGSKAIRGGIPVVFPIFGPPEDDSEMPQHGFARNNRWSRHAATDTDEQATVTYELNVKGGDTSVAAIGTKGLWATDSGAQCRLLYTITMTAMTLTTKLDIKNTGSIDFPIQTLLHSYYNVHNKAALDASKCFVRGLEVYELIDKVDPNNSCASAQVESITITKETDSVYHPPEDKPELNIDIHVGLPYSFHLVAKGQVMGSPVAVSCVVWNPYKEKAKAMSDFGDDQYKEMICVEPGILKGENIVKADGQASLEQIISVVDFNTYFRMPAEWEAHDACFIVYPHSGFTFRLEKARQEFRKIAIAIAVEGCEDVVLFCRTRELAQEVQQIVDKEMQLQPSTSHKLTTRVCPSDDSWARDIGPTFVLSTTNDRNIVGLDWGFNAWGGPNEGCYWPCNLDQVATSLMCKEWNNIQKSRYSSKQEQAVLLTTRKIPLILEGGSIHVDGQGTVLATKECLLNPNRNPTKSQQEIESILLQSLGANKMIWLPYGVDGDEDTNGHVDNWCCFAKPAHLVLSWTDDGDNDSINYKRCREALALLERETDARGRKLTIHKLPLPPPMFYTEEEVESLELYHGEPARQVGERMAGSYVNFYIANKAVIVPQFGCVQADTKALTVLRNIFGPERIVLGVPSKEVLIGGGNIHCITQQLPAKNSG